MGSNTNINSVTTTDASRNLARGAQLADAGGSISNISTVTNYATDLGALATAAHMVDSAVGASSASSAASFGLAGASVDGIAGTARQAMTTVGDLFGGALDAITGGNRQAWSSAGSLVDSAVGNALSAAGTANARAIAGMGGATADAIGAVQSSAARAYGLVDSVIAGQGALFGSALDAVLRSETQSQDAFAGAAGMLNNAYADAKGRGAMTDKLLMVMLVGALGIAAVAISRKG